MADMMASRQVRLLLSPKNKLWKVCTPHVYPPTIGTKGFCWLGILFYFYFTYLSLSYVNRIRIDIIFPPSLPCAIRQRGGGARHHLVMLSHAKMLWGSSRQMGSSGQVQI